MTTYRIAVLLDAYQPDLQGDEKPRIREDVYETIDEAQAVISDEMAQPLYLGHNVYGRELHIVDDVTADYIEGNRNGDGGNYDWDSNDCKRNGGECCGECDECIRMMINQDRDYIRANTL